MPIKRIKSKLSDILYVKSYSCYNITKKNDRTTKAIAAKGIDYKRYRQQKVSATKGENPIQQGTISFDSNLINKRLITSYYVQGVQNC